jgi:hypothetical protein
MPLAVKGGPGSIISKGKAAGLMERTVPRSPWRQVPAFVARWRACGRSTDGVRKSDGSSTNGSRGIGFPGWHENRLGSPACGPSIHTRNRSPTPTIVDRHAGRETRLRYPPGRTPGYRLERRPRGF